MNGSSIAPLEDPVFEYEEVIVASTALNDGLNTNYWELDAQTMKGSREHLYYLLSSYVSRVNEKRYAAI